jgi:hypothetical protein
MSTCPNRTWSLIGIRYVHATMSSANSQGAYLRSSCRSRTWRKENPTVTASATKIPAVHTHCAVSHDIPASSTASIAAMGGYVNGSSCGAGVT